MGEAMGKFNEPLPHPTDIRHVENILWDFDYQLSHHIVVRLLSNFFSPDAIPDDEDIEEVEGNGSVTVKKRGYG